MLHCRTGLQEAKSSIDIKGSASLCHALAYAGAARSSDNDRPSANFHVRLFETITSLCLNNAWTKLQLSSMANPSLQSLSVYWTNAFEMPVAYR
jgi:hypothetical protein